MKLLLLLIVFVLFNTNSAYTQDTLSFDYNSHDTIITETSKYDNLEEHIKKSNSHNSILILLPIIAILGTGAYILYAKRGKNRKVKLEFDINPITYARYMDVTNKKVTSYDCWYREDGEISKRITVSGRLVLEDKLFAKKYKYIVEKSIFDIDANEDFSFKPEGRNPNGIEYSSNQKYEQLKTNQDTDFEFNIIAYVMPGRIPDPTKDNILELKTTMCVSRIEKNERKTLINELSHKYRFIVKEKIKNSNLWVAFDPGTTGSCIAYGATTNPTDQYDIQLAYNEYESVSGEKLTSPIYPSRIYVKKDSPILFNNGPIQLDHLVEGRDFLFGNQAEIFAQSNMNNNFQSIKKLLGYTVPQKIVNKDNVIKEINGQDLAFMLVKGLYNKFEKQVLERDSDKDYIKNMFVQDGKVEPQRAIVAVPNNYTLVKIQEMVDSVKKLHKFKEVHYIYESEAVLMTYLRKSWSNIHEKQNKIHIVFDMGGATINATAFKLSVKLFEQNGIKNIKSIDVKTVAKIGYSIGGDDIDYAIIKFIYNIPSVKEKVEGLGIDAMIHQKQHKIKLIEIARKIKLDQIDYKQNLVLKGNVMIDDKSLYSFIKEKLVDIDIKIDNPSDADLKYIETERKEHKTINEYVLKNVTDAMDELLASLKFVIQTPSPEREIELIISGRSSLYPGIQEKVLNAIRQHNYSCNSPWKGFCDNNGYFKPDDVKSAVVKGACWYAMYCNYINIIRDQVTSIFGFVDIVNMKPKFTPVITLADQFDDLGYVQKYIVPKNPLLNNVTFIQMLGNDTDNIYENEIKHKMNIIDIVHPSEIPSKIKGITLKLDDRSNFDYEISITGMENPVTIKSNPFSRMKAGTSLMIKTEITKENSDAYVFATQNELELATYKHNSQSASHNSNRKRI